MDADRIGTRDRQVLGGSIIVRLDLTESDAQLLATLAEACDDADAAVKRDAIRVSRYIRRRLESERRARQEHEG